MFGAGHEDIGQGGVVAVLGMQEVEQVGHPCEAERVHRQVLLATKDPNNGRPDAAGAIGGRIAIGCGGLGSCKL